MILLYQKLRITLITCIAWLAYVAASAQCPHVFDFYGQVNDDPHWYSCSGNNFTFNLSTPDTWGAFTVNWGDGSPNTSGASWAPPTFQTHTYLSTVDMYTVTITETATGCMVTGTVVMEEASSASIQIPVGGLTQACAPQMMEFINSSTNVSTNSVFTWNFGDGSPILTFDYTNWNQTIQHTYEVGTVTCETVVTLTAENSCNIVQGGFSTATFNPIRIWDLDDPSITPSAMLLCYPDTTVTFNNTTYRNCLFQGNIYQRYEWWNFGDYWGLGHDSIIDWTPWPPTFPHTMHYPGIGSYTVQLLDSNFCGIAPASVTIQIVPPPTAGISASADTVCVGESITFYQEATGGANSYKWNLDNGAGWIISGSGNVSYIYGSPGTYDVGSAVAVQGATAGCSDTAWVQVVVLPKPAVNITADITEGCDSITVDFDAVTPNTNVWQWQFDVPPLGYSGQEPPLIDFNTPGDYHVSLSVIGVNGCAADDDIYVHVYQSPIVDFSVFNLCEGDSAYFTDMSSTSANDSIVSWSWNFGDGGLSNVQNPVYLYDATGSFDVTLTANSSHCVGTDMMPVTVEAAPVASIALDVDSGCAPVSVQFSNNSTSAVTYHWTFSDGAVSEDFEPQHTFYNPSNHDTTYMVTMRAMNAFGCGSEDTLYVTALPSAQASYFDNSNPPGCSPFAALFTNTSQNADSYFWNFGDGFTSVLANPAHTYMNTTGVLGSYTVSLYAYNNNGCNDTTAHNILVYPIADFDFSITGSQGCAPLTATMPFIQGVQGFNWNFGDGQTSSFAVPTHTFQNSSDTTITYQVTLIGMSAFGCVDTASTDVVVYPSPVSQFSLNHASGCGPLTVEITNLSIHGDSYLWDYGDGTSSTVNDPVHSHLFTNTSNNVITRVITLTVSTTDGCSHQYSLSVQIYPEVMASFVDPGAFCTPASVAFNNTSINASSYQWDFGNGLQSVAQNPSSFFTNTTGDVLMFGVSLIAYSTYGCVDTAYQNLVINPTPVAGFSPDVLAGCGPLTVTFTNTSLNADIIGWQYGDGTSSTVADTIHQHTYYNTTNAPLSFNVVLNTLSIEGCSSQYSTTITVYPVVTAAFGDPGVWCSPATVVFNNTSLNAASYEWNFGNGGLSALPNPSSYFTNSSATAIVYDVSLIATSVYGCVDTAHHDLLINHTPIAQFTPDVVAGCSPLTVNFANTSLHADTNEWIYGDGNTSSVADSVHSHIYYNDTNEVQDFEVVLTAASNEGCSSLASVTIQVYPHVTASFLPPGAHCSPANIAFINTSTNAVGYNWDYGNGGFSTMEDPVAYFVNAADSSVTYNVQLMATSPFGCSDITTMPMTIHAAPIADFSMSESAACMPSPVVITNNSVIADAYTWNYGDGQSSTIADSVHTHAFQEPLGSMSDYHITLVASTMHGCVDTASAVFALYPDIISAFSVDTIGCSPFNAMFVNQSVGAVAYNWSFGDAQVSGLSAPSHIYSTTNTTDTVFVAQLVATSMYGCVDTSNVNIHVMHTPQAIAMMDTVFGCFPTVVTFQNGSIGADSYQWIYGTGQTSTVADEYHDFDYFNYNDDVVTYPITLHAYTTYGCNSSDNLSITVPPQITADFNLNAQGCSPLGVYLDNVSDGGVSYSWDFGDGDMSNEYEPQHTFFNWGTNDTTYAITYVLYDSFGCSDTATANVLVYALPMAGFEVTPSEQLWPDATIVLDNTTIGGALNSTWNMDDGTLVYETEPGTHTYNTWGEYNIQLIVSNSACSDTAFRTIEILPPMPIADFTGPAEGCVPLQVQFDNLSEYAVLSNWTFGDGGEANATNPVYTYWQPGTYSVSLTVTGPDGTTDQMVQEQIIHVYPRAQAAFTVTPNEVNVPGEPVYCLNLSVNASGYEWSFGDGGTSVEENPLYYYQTEGDYSIQLIADNQYGCRDTMMLPGIVHASSAGFIDFPNAFTPNPTASNNGFYDPQSFDNDVFFPMHNGVEKYQLQIFNKWGEMLYESNDVHRGWDGYYRGEMSKQDVYVWKVRATFIDGQNTERSGDVTLISK